MDNQLQLPPPPDVWNKVHNNIVTQKESQLTDQFCAINPFHGLSDKERWLIDHESGNDVHAQNPHSTAFGIGQLIESTRQWVASQLGYDPNTTDYAQQLAMFRYYVQVTYGNIDNAIAHWKKHRSY